ncbi:hypothetical protein DPMN_133411 [Dreissena polymorpha]|uniref:Uncharacterized protein n=1 Tax=Dreissena polymorpha TaxID=45954 RepID=A0A9D4JCW5_DREPO|nr:hypothetical protein DPMN_133411 [Dreissena polymorpha]
MRRRMMRPLIRVCAVCLKEFLLDSIHLIAVFERRIFRKDIKPYRKRAKSQNKVKFLPSTAAGRTLYLTIGEQSRNTK